MKTLLKIALVLMLLCCFLPSVILIAQPRPDFPNGQNHNPVFSSETPPVWHKNMELINPLNFTNGYNQEFFETAYIKYDSNSITKHGQFVILSSDGFLIDSFNCVRVIDVTNPRAAKVALEIRIENTSYSFRNFHTTAVWTDPNNDQHTYLAAEIYDNAGVKVVKANPPTIPNDIYSRVLIFDLTEAITLAKTSDSTPPIISVTDPTSRTAVSLDGNPTGSNLVYIGYIPRDDVYFKKYDYTLDSNLITSRTQIHTMTCDPEVGVLSFNTLQTSQSNPSLFVYNLCLDNNRLDPWNLAEVNQKSYVDLYDMSSIPTDANYSTNNFVKPQRIFQGYDGDGHEIPVCIDVINGADSLPVRPHECHLVKKRVLDANGKPTNTFEDDKLMLYVASWGWSHLESNRDGKALGGVIAFEIEGYKNNPTNVSVTQSQYWGYDNDRVYATSNKLSALLSGAYNSKWLRRSTHTVQSVHIDLDNQFFLTADEFGSPFMSLLDSTIGQVNYLSRFKADSTEKTYHYSEWKNLWGYSQTGSAPAEYYNDDRKIGNYIKIWGSDSTQCWVKGLGTNDSTSEIGGPLGSYDTPDILPDDYKKNGKNASLTNSEIRNNSDEFIGGNPNPYFLDATNTSTPQVGPNTCHHLNTVYGITGHLPNDAGLTGDEKYKIRREVYTSNYSQGARVIDLKDFIKGSFSYYDTAKIVRERAYFDCLPTLTYDQSDRYFYMIKDVGRRHIDDCLNKNELNNYFKDQISEYPNYFLGIWDVLPDVADSIYRPELQSDESFVYALGQNAKQGPWLQKGGFLILRYFRDEIGGLITGYASPSGSNVLPFREVNLQGEFKVQRDVTIDTGTTVNILPGRNNDPGIFEKTAFNVGTNGMKRIIVKGTLNVSMPEGDNQQGTSIVFNVPIVVERGGKLVIYKIRNSKTEPVVFNEYVDVDSGGILQINKNAYVAFYTRVFIKGKIDVLGEQDSLATIVGGLDKTKKLPHFTYLHPYEGQAQIYVDGEDVTSIYENRIKLRYGEFRSIPIIVKNAFGFTPVAYRCKFLDSTRYNSQGFPIDYFMDSSMNKPYLYFWYCEGNNNDSKRRIRIIDCIFSDSSEINSVPHFVEQRTLRIGLKITDYKSVYIENCSFYQLKLGAFIKNTPIGQILESNFSYCNMGVHNNASIVHECQDTFRKCIIGSFSNYAYTSNFFDNTFDTVQTGVAIFNSADQFFKGNAFDYYSHGISVLSSTAHLTIYQKPNLLCPNSTPYYIYLGRNVFSYPQFRDTVTEFEMIPESNDINLMDDPADVKLKCGYNDFAENSSYHLSKNPWGYRIVDGSYNKFNPDSTPSHNEYVSINGEHFNESQTANLGCDESLVCADNCQTTPLVINRIEINEDTPLPAIVNLFDTSRFQMNNFSLPPNSRIEYARQTLETGAIIDSVNTLLPDLINDYNSIIADTNFTNSERINARFLKGQIYERLYKIDSAIIVYNDIYNHNITYADSLILKWKLLELNPFIIDTTLGHIFDSLIYIYHKTVADDLLLHSGDGGGQQKQSIQIETNPKDETILVNKIDYVNPNPVTNNSEIQYNINDDCDVAIDVINESGQLIKSLARGFHKAGTYNVRLDAHDMNSGVYLVTMKACDQNSIMKFQVLK